MPFGSGRRFLSEAHGVPDKLVSGWGLSGVTTFQDGLPLAFTASPNLTNSFGGSPRPNVIAGCDKQAGLEFRAEAFNSFNRVQFANPNTGAATAANSTFGWITAQANSPRLIQLSRRLRF